MSITISAGSRAQLTLDAGCTLFVEGNGGLYQVIAPGRPDVATLQRAVGPSGTAIGPFDVSATVQVMAGAAAAARYDLFSPTDVVDRAGRPALSGPIVDAIQALVSDAGPARTALKLVAFGDSIPGNNAIYSNGTDPDGIVPPPWFVHSAVDNSWRSWSLLAWIGPLSLQKIQVERSYCSQTNGLLTAGTAPVGQPVSAQVTRYLADRAAGRVKADRALIMAGSNDVSVFSVAAMVAELLTQIARLDMPIDLLSIPQRGASGNTTVIDVPSGQQMWGKIQQWNAALKNIAAASDGKVRFIDFYALGNTPTAVPDVMRTDRTYDDLHSNNAYGFVGADAYVASVLPSGLAGDLDLWSSNSNAASSGGANMIDQGVINPLMGTASGGTGTGAVAGSHTITNVGTATHVGSVIANPNGVGNLQRIAITSNANNDGVSFATASFHAQGGTFLNAGDEVYLQCLVTINSSGIYPKNLRLQFLALDNLATNWLRKVFDIDAAKEVALPLTAARTLLLRTPSFIVPAGLTFTSVVGSLRPIFAAAGACTIDARFECVRIPAGSRYA